MSSLSVLKYSKMAKSKEELIQRLIKMVVSEMKGLIREE